MKNLYQKYGNTQFRGKVKIGNIELNNSQLQQLLKDNIQWKKYITYSKGQLCSKKIMLDNNISTSFYYSLKSENQGNDPSTDSLAEFWQPLLIQNSDKKIDLLFKIPIIQLQQQLVFQLQFSDNISFQQTQQKTNPLFTSKNNSDLFYCSSQQNQQIVALNNLPLTSVLSGQILFFSTLYNNIRPQCIYFRYRWKNISTNNYSKYYFGKINSGLQSFDGNNIQSVVFSDQKNILGNGSQAFPLTLNDSLQVNKITSVESDLQLRSDKCIVLNVNQQIKINSDDLLLNDCALNQPNGLLKLDINGKIPFEFYNNFLIPSNIDSQLIGNPLVLTKNIPIVENDSNTILLLQDGSKNNQAVSKESVLFTNDKIYLTSDQWYSGGGIIELLDENYVINQLQFTMQFKKQLDLDVTLGDYFSILQFLAKFEQQEKIITIARNVDNISLFVDNQRIVSTTANLLWDDNDITKIFVIFDKRQNSLIVYSNGIEIIKYYSDLQFFIDNKIFFAGQTNSKSTIYPMVCNWRLLKIDLKNKEQVSKPIGQLYNSNISTDTVSISYRWQNVYDSQSFLNANNDIYIFVKKDNVPYTIPYNKLKMNYKLPTADRQTLGGVIIGNGLSVDNGVISVNGVSIANDGLSNFVAYGDIYIRSEVNNQSSVTVESGSLIDDQGIGGRLFLGNIDKQYSSLQFNNISGVKNTLFYSRLYYTYNCYIDVRSDQKCYICADDILFNNNATNSSNGLLKLDGNGNIPAEILSSSLTIGENSEILIDNQLKIYGSDDNITYFDGIAAGNGITFTNKQVVVNDQIRNVVVINADQSGQLRSDVIINYVDAINQVLNGNADIIKDQNTEQYYAIINISSDKKNYFKIIVDYDYDNQIINDIFNIYVYIQNVTIGGLSVQNQSGYLIYPVQKSIVFETGQLGVMIDLTQFVLAKKGDFLQSQHYIVRFIRGKKGVSGELTKQEAIGLIFSFLL